MLDESHLLPGPTESIYKAAEGSLSNQYRDIFKYYHNAGIMIASYGMENQSTIDEDAVIRIMGYDYASYRAQIKRDEIDIQLYPLC